MLHAVVAREHAAIMAARGAPPQLGVLGFSQGVAMSMRFAADLSSNPSLGRAPQLNTHVLWAGGLAHDVSNQSIAAAWPGTTVRVVVGERDQFATDAFRDAVRTRLQAIGVTTTEHAFAGGHRLDTPLLRELLARMILPDV
jgi:dienelactone hydrolase